MRENEKDTAPGFVYIWEYEVAPEHVGEFERLYGPDGDWARLFRRHPGYLRTELHRDLGRPRRYVTVDYWGSRQARDELRTRFEREWEELDARGERLSVAESHLGDFAPVKND